MSNDIMQLEKKLADLTGRRECVLTSRATTALFLAFTGLGAARGNIIFPATLCPSPAYAAIYAGHKPIFCDVEPDTGNMSPTALKELLKVTSNVVAITAAHLYGQPSELGSICAIAAQHQIPVIEDVAQALGATMKDGTPAGNFGICSVLSFGYSKIIDVGYGGALVTDDLAFANSVRSMEKQLPTPSKQQSKLAQHYRSEYYRIRSAAALSSSRHSEFLNFPERFKPLFINRFVPFKIEATLEGLKSLGQNLAARHGKADLYDRQLADSGVVKLRRDAGAAPWRYCVLLPADEQTRITLHLRSANFDASNWYPSLHRWFGTEESQGQAQPNESLTHEDKILNLWLDHNVDEKKVLACGKELAQLLSGKS
tara:strand:- start:9431 stop:10540 length:1110 start_codon:yes stop_codon:yes gene_type:complete